MSEVVTRHVEDGIGTLRFHNPPTNALTRALRAAMLAELRALTDEEGLRAVVLLAEGGGFSSGADLDELVAPPAAPSLTELTRAIEDIAVPVVAGLQGAVVGGGVDLALAAHYRVASATARLGYPEITLGLVPAGGGTQRLPRIVGAEEALDILLGGRPMTAEVAMALGIVDDVVRGDVEAAAVVFARGLVNEGIGPRPTAARHEGFADPVGFANSIAARRTDLGPAPEEAAARMVDCVEAAQLLPFDAGLTFEQSVAEDLAGTDRAQALCHVVMAERRAGDTSDVRTGKARAVAAVGVVGGGTMGAGVVAALLQAGLPVVMVERDHQNLAAAEARVRGIFDRAVERGRMSERDAAIRRDLMIPTIAVDGLADVDFVIEAVNEPRETKARVLSELDRVLKPGTVIGITSPTADLNALAAVSGRSGDLVGLHFHPPAHLVRLVELAVTGASTADAVATAAALARKLGKTVVRTTAGKGRIGARVQAALIHAADDLLGQGASPAEIDAAMRAYGFRMGPFQMLDLGGLDQPMLRAIRRPEDRDPSERSIACAELVWEEMLARGWTGHAAGRGYYRAGAEETDDPEFLTLIEAARREFGLKARDIPAEEIQRRCVLAMANCGARLLGEGVAMRPSDIDVVMIHGHGFPRDRGGPMKAADLIGLLKVQRTLQGFAPDADSIYGPAPLIHELVKNGRSFGEMNRGKR